MQCTVGSHRVYYKRKRSQPATWCISTLQNILLFSIQERWKGRRLISFLPHWMEKMSILLHPLSRRSSNYLGLSWTHIRIMRAAWKALWKEMKVWIHQTLFHLKGRSLSRTKPLQVSLMIKSSSASIVSRSLQTHRHWGVTKMPIRKKEWRRRDCSFKPGRPASDVIFNLSKTTSVTITTAQLHGSTIPPAVLQSSHYMKSLRLVSITMIKIPILMGLRYQSGMLYQLRSLCNKILVHSP